MMNKVERGWAYMDNCPRWLWRFLQADGAVREYSDGCKSPYAGYCGNAAFSRIGEYLGSWQPGYVSIKVENRL